MPDHRRPGVNSIRIRPPRPWETWARPKSRLRARGGSTGPAKAAFAGDAGVTRAVLTARRSKRGEAAVIGVGVLDFLAVGDRSRRGDAGRRGRLATRLTARAKPSLRAKDEAIQDRPWIASSRPARSTKTACHPLSVAPHFFSASDTIFWATASISESVSVFSRGCSVTARPIDFLPSGTPLPS